MATLRLLITDEVRDLASESPNLGSEIADRLSGREAKLACDFRAERDLGEAAEISGVAAARSFGQIRRD